MKYGESSTLYESMKLAEEARRKEIGSTKRVLVGMVVITLVSVVLILTSALQ